MPLIPLILPSSSSTVGISLQTYRKRLARTLGYYAEGTVTTVAASLEAERYVISTTLRSDAPPPEHWDGLYVYVRDGAQAGAVRKLVNGGYEGTVGALMVDYPFDAPLQSGVGFEVSVLPATRFLGLAGWNEIINEGLEELPVLDYVSITVTETSGVKDTEYALDGYAWPIKAIDAVVYPRQLGTSERRREMPKGYWSFQNDAEVPTLSFNALPANVGDTIEVRLRRPAHTRIRRNGTWTDTSDGMSLETDQGIYPAADVVRQCRPIAMRRMALAYKRGSDEYAQLMGEAGDAHVEGVLSKFYSGIRSTIPHRVGGIGGR